MKKIIHIKWMHCISCELILEKGIKEISSVNLIMVDHKKGIVEIDFEEKSDYEKVIKIIEKNGFSVIEKWQKNINENNILSNIIAVLVVIILFITTQIFDLSTYLPDTSSLSYFSAFLIWIIASVSTCLAITGGIIIWFSRYIDSTHWIKWHIKVQLLFQIWRILWFFILWWILWLVWKVFTLSLSLTWIITYVVWFLLLYMGLNILGIIPSFTKLWIHMPKSFVSKIEKIWQPKFAPIVWALTFFLPCWFTQTIQLLAVSSGSFLIWWLVMMAFALWTAPVLFSVWLWSSYFKDKKFKLLNKIIWAIVIFLWIFTISNSYNLLQINNISDSQEIKQNTEQTQWENTQLQIVNVWFDGSQTVPETIKLKAWWNYKIIVTPTSNWKWCMSTQVIPDISKQVSYVLKWVPIEYEILNAKVWTYNIVCTSMWMKQGEIVVE